MPERLGRFDQVYSDRMMEACLRAIVETAHDRATNTAILRNGEIYDAILRIVATFLATSKEAETPHGIRVLCDDFSKTMRKRIVAAREEMSASGVPFDVVHFSEYQ